MKKVYSLLFLLAAGLPFIASSQARLMINGTSAVYMVESGGSLLTPIYIEVNNPASNAISTLGKKGWIISESEFNMVKWDIGTSANVTDTVPFGYSTTNRIPLVFNVPTGDGGTGATGGIEFSTYHTPALNTPLPSGVSNVDAMYLPASPGPSDNSYNVVDRFWIVDPVTYGAAANYPKPIITFGYIDGAAAPSEVITPNVFTETNLIAQRFNTTIGKWSDFLGAAGQVTVASPLGTCGTGPTVIATTNFFRAWTLSNKIDPLPIELTSFNVACNNGAATITWTTQSEINNDHFTVERSTDGVNYDIVATVPGAGNSTTTLTYTATDPNPLPGTSYYRLSQTDFDGNVNSFSPVSFSGCDVSGVTVGAFLSNGNYGRMIVRLNAPQGDNYDVTLVSALGQVLVHETKSLPAGYNEFTLDQGNLTYGVYLLSIRSANTNYTKKFVLGAW